MFYDGLIYVLSIIFKIDFNINNGNYIRMVRLWLVVSYSFSRSWKWDVNFGGDLIYKFVKYIVSFFRVIVLFI